MPMSRCRYFAQCRMRQRIADLEAEIRDLHEILAYGDKRIMQLEGLLTLSDEAFKAVKARQLPPPGAVRH